MGQLVPGYLDFAERQAERERGYLDSIKQLEQKADKKQG